MDLTVYFILHKSRSQVGIIISGTFDPLGVHAGQVGPAVVVVIVVVVFVMVVMVVVVVDVRPRL